MAWRICIFLLCSAVRECVLGHMGLWIFLNLMFALPIFSWRSLPQLHQRNPHFMSLRGINEASHIWSSRRKFREMQKTLRNAEMSFRVHHIEAKTYGIFWRYKCLFHSRRGTDWRPRRSSLRANPCQHNSCNDQLHQHLSESPCSACWESSIQNYLGGNGTDLTNGYDGYSHFFHGLEGQEYSEYYGTEDPRPYTDDGEFWHTERKFDDFLDRWDTYDARCTEDECCDDCIFAVKVRASCAAAGNAITQQGADPYAASTARLVSAAVLPGEL